MTTANFTLPRTLAAWNTPDFRDAFKREIEALDADMLPLQQGLALTSSVADEPFHVVPIAAEATPGCVRVKAGVFYAGIIGGCSCADDPTPVEPQPEHCVLFFEIDRTNAEARVELLSEE